MSNEKTKHHPVCDDTTPRFPGTVSGVEPEPSGEQRILHPSETNVPQDHTSTSENMYRTIFETTGTAIIVIEGDKTISMANSELEKITGFKKEEVEGKKKWTEFIAARDLQRLIGYHELRRK
ncbi:MAG TPA: PAS domain S-box protein, partial [Spirochaetota bacterium]|nr:PAS domain S-box protein [Spirochaetota bacterium]